jgi:hypothetical protein
MEERTLEDRHALYVAKAAEAREHASRVNDAESRKTWQDLADKYQQLAEHVLRELQRTWRAP